MCANVGEFVVERRHGFRASGGLQDRHSGWDSAFGTACALSVFLLSNTSINESMSSPISSSVDGVTPRSRLWRRTGSADTLARTRHMSVASRIVWFAAIGLDGVCELGVRARAGSRVAVLRKAEEGRGQTARGRRGGVSHRARGGRDERGRGRRDGEARHDRRAGAARPRRRGGRERGPGRRGGAVVVGAGRGRRDGRRARSVGRRPCEALVARTGRGDARAARAVSTMWSGPEGRAWRGRR